MTKADEWIKTCIKKDRYSSEASAKKGAEKFSKKRGIVLYQYYCPHCHGWHLTKRPTADSRWSEKLSIANEEIKTLKSLIESKDKRIEELQSLLTRLQEEKSVVPRPVIVRVSY